MRAPALTLSCQDKGMATIRCANRVSWIRSLLGKCILQNSNGNIPTRIILPSSPGDTINLDLLRWCSPFSQRENRDVFFLSLILS
ncbi:hypothetical protein TNCT_173881 [Trichonephila clavata]|uniref:Uncharacterized protein n=1 Tax=Trichonephila clavata TaxID=2740835 RepID=A0A8X6FU15_TRICU|nr:hypothetical protein TNCT_173881 [Trichonephila clavata]